MTEPKPTYNVPALPDTILRKIRRMLLMLMESGHGILEIHVINGKVDYFRFIQTDKVVGIESDLK